jgi:hypothetical protein
MIKVLFKSEELLIAADSESKVVYGNTSKNTVVAKQIKVTTKTEVVVKTAKSSMVKTAEDALRIAAKFNLEEEVQRELNNGATPLEALREWDII